ncbi:MAG: hypothetical protein COB98_00225 [Flavobacteriaceae bacterium]|nr:MAG: hypothetical protein COB98_00225 [Flavobacteriaceae bacterium]
MSTLRKISVSFALLIFTCHIATSQQQAQKPTIKILSFNIYHGENTHGDGNIASIAALIKNLQPDFVGLQEVDLKTERSNFTDFSNLLAARTNMSSLFGKAIDFNKGAYGLALLSKHRLKKTIQHRLPNKRYRESRILIAVNSLIDQHEIQVINTHLDHAKSDKLRLVQSQFINKLFCNDSLPKILIGDLNAVPNSEPIQQLKNNWKLTDTQCSPTATYPSNAPNIKIDYIMVYPPNKWKIISSTVINTGEISDHLAYFVTLQLL